MCDLLERQKPNRKTIAGGGMRVVFVCLMMVLMGLQPRVALAQNPFAAARVVNESIISNYEISQRVRLLQALGLNSPDVREIALRQLTEDRVKQQAAARIGLQVDEETVARTTEGFAKQRQMSVGGLKSRMASNNVAPESFDDFITSQTLWRSLITLRFRERASPSEADIENALNYAASRAQESVYIREIAIPFAERGQNGARQLAARITRDVNNGASFSALARRYSRTASAQRGGDVGWSPVNRLPPQIASQLLTLSPGEVTAPIIVSAGVILLQLVDIREDAAADRGGVSATYIRLDVPIGQPTEAGIASAITDASALAKDLMNCRDAQSRIADYGPLSGRYGPDPLPEIPPDIGLTLANLDADEAGVTAATSDRVSVIILCSRTVDADVDQVEALRNQLFNQRMINYGNGYLQELLADAVIVDK